MGLRVVIPVAGQGTRLRPHTHTLPKVLVHVAGKPMLGHILDELRKYDVEEITLIIGHLGEKIREYVAGAFPYRFRFIEQPEMKGLGHAIWLSAPGYRESGGPLLVILGDTLFDADFASILGSEENWIGVKEVADPRRFGVVVLKDGRITAMVEKPKDPPSNLAIVGIYYFKASKLLYDCLDEIVSGDVRTSGEIQLTDALDRMLRAGAVMKPFEIRQWFDCGKPETLLETNRLLLEKYDGEGGLAESSEHPGCLIYPPVAIEKGVTLEKSILGPHVSVGEGAEIRNCIIDDSIISKNAVVVKSMLTQSIIADNARVEGHRGRLNVGDASDIKIG